ncbi:hypothetical protein CPB86DRAFT_793448 [Serendipita vermifera]|nr:hypothetical protein CPB86DRAFT_793448 [Serendipita vermifera]
MLRLVAFIRHWIFAFLIALSAINIAASALSGGSLTRAVSVISTILSLSLLIIDLRRKGGAKTWFIVELGWLGLLWVLWTAAAAKVTAAEIKANTPTSTLHHTSSDSPYSSYSSSYGSYGSYRPLLTVPRFLASLMCLMCGSIQLSTLLWPGVALVTMQLILNVIMAFTSPTRRFVTSVWFSPTSTLFHREEEEEGAKTKHRVYGNTNMNESGHGFKGAGAGVGATPSIAASSTPTVTGYNASPAYQGYPPSPSTPQGSYPRRNHNHAQVDEYVEMADNAQYEKAQYARQPQTPISPFS